MDPTASPHPAAIDLADYVLGKLSPASAEWIAQHLEHCPACRAAAERVQGPAYTIRPTAATPPPQGSLPRGEMKPAALAPEDIPPALRDHARYRILRQIGRGGMGVVYQAEHRVMERLVAVKVIGRTLLANPEAMERFQREVRAAAKLNHPNIVKAYDAEQAGDLQLLAMEYVEGHSLAEVLEKKGPLPISNACHYVRQAAQGLQHAFERGMVHRDLKPQNLMLTPKGVVKILDFGLAKLASEQGRPGAGLTQENAVMGTPEYMAPEQAQSTKAADIRADIYALGCTLYCLLTGRPPFVGVNPLGIIVAHALEAPPPVESLRPDVPADLAALVHRLMEKKPEDRLQTPKELAEALAPFAKAATLRAAAVPIAKKPKAAKPVAPRRPQWLLPAVAIGVLFAAVGVIAGIGMWLRGSGGDVKQEVDPVAATPVDSSKTATATAVKSAAPIRRPIETPIVVDLGGGVTMEFVRIPAGSFTMGSPKEAAGRRDGEDEHVVRISKDFYLGKYPVTQAQYTALIGKNPSNFCAIGGGKEMVAGLNTSKFPVEQVAWGEAVAFCGKLSARDEKKRKFQLPTEAEWEYACRAGTTTVYYFGDSLDGTQANCNGDAPFNASTKGPHLARTCPVGSYQSIAPHPWGLCDMHGNVWQWCRDWFDASYYKRSPAVDPLCTDGEQKNRVIRGGSWRNVGAMCRAATRGGSMPGRRIIANGFRVVLYPD